MLPQPERCGAEVPSPSNWNQINRTGTLGIECSVLYDEPWVVFEVCLIVGHKGHAQVNGMCRDEPIHGVTTPVANCRAQYAKTLSVRFRKWQHGDFTNQQRKDVLVLLQVCGLNFQAGAQLSVSDNGHQVNERVLKF
jgi:hypothetical protein